MKHLTAIALLFGAYSAIAKPAPETMPNAASSSMGNKELTISSWNIEHLAYPISDGCRPRSESELNEMKAYAQSLNTDVVGLQEVASKEAIEQIFPKENWQVFISDRPDSESYKCRESGRMSSQQKVGFAVRKGIEVQQVKSLPELALDSRGLRYGLELTIESPHGLLSILNVHMKSGCFVDDYSRSDSRSCQVFSKQAPILDSWVESKEKAGLPYVMVGDFNHRLSAPYNKLTGQLTVNTDNSASTLENTTADLIGCHPYYPAPIDHIWVGNLSSNIAKKASVASYKNMDPKAMLSDHCAVSLKLTKEKRELTNSVKWHTTSKEYAYLTSTIYQQASKHLNVRDLPNGSWSVVMDIDETVLDNSAYQANLDRTGSNYTPLSWANWVRSEKATLVPGVKEFIDTVIAKGGKLALITNRDRKLDAHTWQNMRSLGLPVSAENTCLIGRTAADKKAIDHQHIKNDKDLRRQQIEQGTASCYASKGKRSSQFSNQTILMQIGDNIEDFRGVVQHKVNVQDLIAKSKGDLILLPNAMYGSW
ncbi:HAD family acid phosphatase [Psychrosphaera haliotis]|uniref:Endonuclease/exonuclease/phosphatase n=1 Tax=Psychrosphaera haliotis TaxID=555083 RepID=A0A6N8FE52_9GAMM|nr:HAD family acid phosphatase [Psychrosphaera haliotis]MUH72952.1 endonuclease/exonuclease/phosphatase [Psychrosphaera haliotis]